MLAFDRNKASVVAGHTQDSFQFFDRAYLTTLQLAASFLEAKAGSGLPERESQRLMQTVHDSASSLLAGRAGMVAATAILQRFQSRSNQAETNFGCPGAGPWRTMAEEKAQKAPSLTVAA